MTYFGDETKKALVNFGRGETPLEVVSAYSEVKEAALSAVQENEKRFSDEVFNAILQAIYFIRSGSAADSFPLGLRQGGAGTSLNMNMNEVIASIAMKICRDTHGRSEKIDPIEDINRYQSTNDTFPTAVTIIASRRLAALEKTVIELQESLIRNEENFSRVLMAGRTEMQSALPVTLGQVFASWAGPIERDRWRLSKIKERLRTVALGGTAIGTCFFAPQKYIFLAEKHLRRITGLSLSRSQNLTDEISNLDKFTELANGISQLAGNIYKMTGDLLLYTSSMVGEIRNPHLQYGSTIMAAKINPVILEFARGLSIDAEHECAKIADYAKNGQLQLNAYLPFVLHSLLGAFDSVETSARALLEKFIANIEINDTAVEKNLVASNVLLNTLVPLLGYAKVKELFNEMKNVNCATMEDFKKFIIEKTGLDAAALDEELDPIRATSSLKE